MSTTVLLSLSLGVLLLGLIFLFLQLRKLRSQHQDLTQTHQTLRQRFEGVLDAEEEERRILQEAEAERQRFVAEIEQARTEAQRSMDALQQQQLERGQQLEVLKANIALLQAEFAALDEEANLQSFGFYQPRYDFASSERYQTKLEEIREQQKQMLKAKTAAVSHSEWTVNGSRVEGRKQINQTLKLMLRAFNGECDAAIAKVKYNNVHVMQTRIRKAQEAINALVTVQRCEITRAYLQLKLEELFLAHEYQEKVQAEKEEQRQIREQMREEEIAQRQFEKAKLEAEREEKRYEDALRKAREEVNNTVGAKQQSLLEQISLLEKKLEEAHANKERAIARAQMTRSGHVYVISNIGSFGEHVYKIGMTRRLDPMERIRELGDASVPFQFDVHAIIYTEDAPTLENRLHKIFNHRRINMVNERKEFFEATIDEIADAVRMHDAEIELTRLAEAEEYRKSQSIRSQRQTGSARSAEIDLRGMQIAPVQLGSMADSSEAGIQLPN